MCVHQRRSSLNRVPRMGLVKSFAATHEIVLFASEMIQPDIGAEMANPRCPHKSNRGAKYGKLPARPE